jgi:hypothetical protein
MYKALKGFYIILAALGYKEKRKPLNEFTIILRPYSAFILEVINNILAGFKILGRG